MGPTTNRRSAPFPSLVLSYGFWTRHFGADSSILNKQINVNGTLLTVVGVTRAGFNGVQIGDSPDVFVPITMTSQVSPNWPDINDHKVHWLALIGRFILVWQENRLKLPFKPFFIPFSKRKSALERVPPKTQPQFLARKLLLMPGSQGRPSIAE